ncbi:MAG TPA: hypothetical protein VMV22_14400 [Acidimicrobiales bacterium]|nr:hypothetical protein [Acidimicrobiales bacterium]
MGSKASFSSGTSAYYSDGSTGTVCDSSSGTPSCYTGATPPTGLLSLINPAQVAGAIRSAEAAVTVNHSMERHYSQMSSCVAYMAGTQHVKYCLDQQGTLTFIRIPTGAFDLTAYTTTVSDSDVSVPAGATTRPAPTNS